MKYKLFVIIAILAVIALSIMPLSGAFSQTYDLSYSAITNGGGAASSTDYSIDLIIKATGVEEGENQSSANYTVTSVLDEPQPSAAVEDWMLF
jgi:hypothetical protein